MNAFVYGHTWFTVSHYLSTWHLFLAPWAANGGGLVWSHAKVTAQFCQAEGLCPFRQLLSKCPPPSTTNGLKCHGQCLLTQITKCWCHEKLNRQPVLSQHSHNKIRVGLFGLGFIFWVAWMRYRFKQYWLHEHMMRLSRVQADRQGGNFESSQSYRSLSSVQDVRGAQGVWGGLAKTPLVSFWPGWRELPCVWVSWAWGR